MGSDSRMSAINGKTTDAPANGSLGELRKRRAALFRGETFPYFRYVFQSGFGLVASAIAFTIVIGYVRLLREVPVAWPSGLVGVCLLTAAALSVPVRTYMQQADTVFLMPLERRVMDDYLQPYLRRSIAGGVVRTLLIFALYAPLYVSAPLTEKAAEARPLALLVVLLAGIAAWNGFAGWRERTMPYAVHRVSFSAARWGLTATAVAGLLLGPIVPAAVFAIAGPALAAVLWRFVPSQYVPWEALVRGEAAARRRWFRFLSLFVDVPEAPSRPAKRSWLAWLPQRMRWERGAAWFYMYGLVFIRGETFGAFYRLTIVGCLLLVVADGFAADVAIYAIVLLALGMQLTELGRLRFAEAAFLTPADPSERSPAASTVGRIAGLSAAIVLGAIGLVPWAGTFPYWCVAAAAASLWWTGWRIPRSIARRISGEDEE